MKKLGLCSAALLGLLFMIAPGRASEEKKKPFWGRNFAHRGLYTEDQKIPENSITAFKRAVEAGYGMELDVQLSKDGEVVVFHDDDLLRVCGIDARVDSMTFEELRQLRLFDSDEQIPLFSEVLKTVNRRAPIIVELKNGPRNKMLCEKTKALLDEYHGETCVESFNPLIVAWFRFHGKEYMRGVLAQQPHLYLDKGMSSFGALFLGCVLMNFLARPEFIAYRKGWKPLAVKVADALGAVRAVWTPHDTDSEKKYDMIIFEYYEPKAYYKTLAGKA